MTKNAINALGVSVALTLSLYLWSVFYPATDWSVLALVPLALLLFRGAFRASAVLYRASLRAAVRADSTIEWLLTGKMRALLGATLFTPIAVYLLGWHALSSSQPEMLLFAFLCFVAALLFAGVEQKLLDHLTPPFARATALSVATLVAAVLFVPVLAWTNWNNTLIPGSIRTASLEEAIQLGIGDLPERRGLIAEILAPVYVFEYGKLWFVVQSESPEWFSLWYCINASLVSLVAARASALLMSVVKEIESGTDG